MELGIAGVPDDVNAVEAVCDRLGLAPVYLLGPGETMALEGQPLHLLHVPAWEADAVRERVRGTGLRGLWAASRSLRGLVSDVAAHLGLPSLPCPEDRSIISESIGDVRLLEPNSLGALQDAGQEALPLPFWVRAACGNGDSSCMRIDHAHDLPLAMERMQKRGLVRLQPAVDGPVYRLMAFKTGRDLLPFDLVAEETTTSMYRVPLSLSMPVPRRGGLLGAIIDRARRVNRGLPPGWGYVEMEFVDSEAGLRLVDVQSPAALDPLLREVVLRSQGVDLLQAVLQCAAGRHPQLVPVREMGAAMTWLLTRSGTVEGFQGVEEALEMPGIEDVRIVARPGDVLTHVVDLPSRERGGYVIATGPTPEAARSRLEAAREKVWINTTPVQA